MTNLQLSSVSVQERGKPALKPIHPFPARMAPSIVLDQLRSLSGLRVLDPMSGSGTTLAVAKNCGHHAVGFDVDPLAVVLAAGWCAEVDGDTIRLAAERALAAARQIASNLSAGDAFPCSTKDEETREFVRYWFDETNRLQLTALSRAIARRRDPIVRTVLWCGFSRMIIAKTASVSLAIDIPHSRPHRVRDNSDCLAFDRFLLAVETVLRAIPFPSPSNTGSISIALGDARCLPLPASSIDLVVTSPPYLNAINYLRCSKFSLVWMGYSIAELRQVRATSIGTEVGLCDTKEQDDIVLRAMTNDQALPARGTAMLRRYIADMRTMLSEVARVLVPRGNATIVIGDSTLRGVFIQNSLAVQLLSVSNGLSVMGAESRQLPDNLRYMPPPATRNNTFASRMRTEVVVRLHKPR